MNTKRILLLLAGLLLVVPVLAWAQESLDPRDSIILESKTVAPSLSGPAIFTQKVYLTNKDTIAILTLSLEAHSIVGTAYADLDSNGNDDGWTLADCLTFLKTTLDNSPAEDFSQYTGDSPDRFLVAATFSPTGTNPVRDAEPINATRSAIWELKYMSSDAALGQMRLDTVRLAQSTGMTIIRQRGQTVLDIPVNYLPGVITVDVPPCQITNCAGAGGNLLYGRPYTYDFDADVAVTWSVAVGPGAINPATGVYTFAGQCPLGAIPVTVVGTDAFQRRCECTFTLNVIDNAPSCTPVQANVSVSHGQLATNHINTSDPDAGDVVSVSQTSGPGSTTPGGDWSYQTSCADIGANPQTVQEQVVDGFGNCIPGPQSATCQFQLTVTNAAPSAVCPPNAQVQAGNHYSAQASGNDADPADAGNLTFFLISGPAGLTVSPSGQVNWDPTALDNGPHQVCIGVRDLCGASGECCYTVTVVVGQKFHICIDTIRAFQGTDVEVGINNLVQANDPNTLSNENVGGFSFLLSYDCSCLQFLSARQGSMLVEQRWEFFTYRYGAVGNGNCGAGCPSCLIRIVAIADVNNGATHPLFTGDNEGQWVVLKFRTSNDRTLAGQCCPISWFWFDCNDNTISDETGNVLWVVNSLTNTGGSLEDLSLAFPNDVSNCDAFSGGPGKPTPRKFIDFCNGQICLPTPQEIDDRGDLNLNGLKNEIADAVLYENYFIYGSSVLSSNAQRRQGQIAASDVNGDGQVLSVADLVAMLRIITGDANPLPRMNPAAGAVSLEMTSAGSEWTVAANSASDLGGLYLKFKVNGSVGTPVLSGAAEGMTLKANLVGDEYSILIYSEAKGQRIEANAGALFKMQVDGSAELITSEAADYYGIALPTLAKAAALPTAFGLSQNYPNPFNGRTSFVLALPVASDYKVTVYNVTGQVVRTFEGSGVGNRTITWDGTDMNGNAVSSGIYFFKAAAKDFNAVVKGLYLK